jgi:hypothetical protein
LEAQIREEREVKPLSLADARAQVTRDADRIQPSRLSAPVSPRSGQGTTSAYATALYGYADGRLEDKGLRAWMTQRLMLDLGVDHAYARFVSATTIDASASHDPAPHASADRDR